MAVDRAVAAVTVENLAGRAGAGSGFGVMVEIFGTIDRGGRLLSRFVVQRIGILFMPVLRGKARIASAPVAILADSLSVRLL